MTNAGLLQLNDEQQATIERLQAELAAMTEHSDKQFKVISESLDLLAVYREKLEAMTQECASYKAMVKEQWAQPELAAAQADNQRLREAIEINGRRAGMHHGKPAFILDFWAERTLALPCDDTALKQWGAKLLREACRAYDGSDLVGEWLTRVADELEGKK